MTWLSFALGLVQLLNYVFGRLDADAKKRAAEALVNSENMKADMEAIARANAARDAVKRDLGDDDGRVRASDPDARKPKARPRKGGV